MSRAIHSALWTRNWSVDVSEVRFLDLLFAELDVAAGDAQHPAILKIGEQIASGQLTHVEARPILRRTLIEIERQERGWERIFVN